jgi:transposase
MTGKSTKKTRRKYDTAFKEEVLKMVASGRSVPEIAQALGIGENLVYRWKNVDKTARSNARGNSSDSSPHPDLFLENERLKAELRRTEQERDILKKALGIFSRGNQ